MSCNILTSNQVDEFIRKGYVALRGVLPRELIDQWWEPRRAFLDAISASALWSKFGQSLQCPRTTSKPLQDISHRVVLAVRQLTGERHVPLERLSWGDGFSVTIPIPYGQSVDMPLWHKDGFHKHFLDSPEIGLVCLVLWTDTHPENGATALADCSIEKVACHLLSQPQGCDPDKFECILPTSWPTSYATGKAGDVYFIHPFLLHARRPNWTGSWRAITNPVVPLLEPMCFQRSDNDYSPIETAILKALGEDFLSYAARGSRTHASSRQQRTLDDARIWLAERLKNWQISGGISCA
jgi:hypothetical protein